MAILVLAGIECNTAFVKNATIGAVFGRSDILCTNWPSLETARRILSEHSDTIQKLHQVPNSGIWRVLIEERMMMRDIIGDDQYFFGVPYVMFDS